MPALSSLFKPASSLVLAAFVAGGCASSQPAARRYGFQAVAPQKDAPALLWTASVDAPVSVLAPARGGRAVFLATSRVLERTASVVRFGLEGRKLWETPVDSPVKWMSPVLDGSFVAVATEAGNLHGLNDQGTIIWTVKEPCRPKAVSRDGGRILCYFEDRSLRESAFHVFDLLGEKLFSYKHRGRPAVFAVSPDESHVAVAFLGGQVHLIGSGFKLERQYRLKGEIIDLEIPDGEKPGFVALYHPGTRMIGAEVRLGVFGAKGETVAADDVRLPVTRMSASADGRSVFLYGNGPQGQILARFVLDESPALVQRWMLAHPQQGNHLGKPLPINAGEGVVFAFDDVLFGIGPLGRVHWERRLSSEHGAYLLEGTRPAEGEPHIAAVVTDRGELEVYDVK